MSIQALCWAFRQHLPCAEKFVLVALCDMADMDGKCWPSQALLAERCGIARETVNRQIKALANAGMIRVENRTNATGKQSSLYFVLCDAESQPDVTQDHMRCDAGSLTNVTDDHIESSLEPSLEPKKDKSSRRGEFAVWYTAYPRHVARAEAEKAYDKARKEASAADLLAGIERYREGKPEYADWSHPASWLNKKRWLDEYGTASPSSGHDYPTEPPPPPPPPFELHH